MTWSSHPGISCCFLKETSRRKVFCLCLCFFCFCFFKKRSLFHDQYRANAYSLYQSKSKWLQKLVNTDAPVSHYSGYLWHKVNSSKDLSKKKLTETMVNGWIISTHMHWSYVCLQGRAKRNSVDVNNFNLTLPNPTNSYWYFYPCYSIKIFTWPCSVCQLQMLKLFFAFFKTIKKLQLSRSQVSKKKPQNNIWKLSKIKRAFVQLWSLVSHLYSYGAWYPICVLLSLSQTCIVKYSHIPRCPARLPRAFPETVSPLPP